MNQRQVGTGGGAGGEGGCEAGGQVAGSHRRFGKVLEAFRGGVGEAQEMNGEDADAHAQLLVQPTLHRSHTCEHECANM